jgi:hypothetical protein
VRKKILQVGKGEGRGEVEEELVYVTLPIVSLPRSCFLRNGLLYKHRAGTVRVMTEVFTSSYRTVFVCQHDGSWPPPLLFYFYLEPG